jgi:hypothetical protein
VHDTAALGTAAWVLLLQFEHEGGRLVMSATLHGTTPMYVGLQLQLPGATNSTSRAQSASESPPCHAVLCCCFNLFF